MTCPEAAAAMRVIASSSKKDWLPN